MSSVSVLATRIVMIALNMSMIHIAAVQAMMIAGTMAMGHDPPVAHPVVHLAEQAVNQVI